MNTLQRKIKAVVSAVDWRIRSRFGDEVVDRRIVQAASSYRRRLGNTVFFGIAGSVGKTTAKDLLVGILKVRGRTIGNPVSRNAAPEIAKVILRTRPWHKFCVAELGETAPDSLNPQLAVLQPSIGIITVVGDDHLAAFGSRQAIAQEFAKLVRALPADGTVVLNLDDELVAGLAKEAGCPVITYGRSANADLRASDIVAIWPEPLQFTVRFNNETASIRTRLYGEQLLTSALAAIAGGLAAGLTLAECAEGIRRVPPAEGRMQPVFSEQGITFIRDDFKAPAWTVAPLLDQLHTARAIRKIFVLGSISDCESKERGILKITSKALDIADVVIVFGRFSSGALKARKVGTESRLYTFTRIRDLADLLKSIGQHGDLILMKGSEKKDHMSRIVLSQTQTVNCWIDDCDRDMFCSECSHLESHRGPPGLVSQANATLQLKASSPSEFPSVNKYDQVILGLGNPGQEFFGTPHNVGYEALDFLCSSHSGIWEEFPEAWISNISLENRSLYLIKIKVPMNLTGPILKQLSERMAFDAAQCIIVFDDIDLPLGNVRTRMNGSAGGHRGVASILEAFQSDQFRRVKIGVKSPLPKQPNASIVLTRFDDDSYASIQESFKIANKQMLDLVSGS